MITEYSEFPESVPRERIINDCLDTVGCLGKGWGTEKITFIEDRVFQTYSEAQRFLSETANDDPDGYAVLFETYDRNLVNNDPVVMAVRDNIRKLQLSVDNYRDHVQAAYDPKLEFVTCRNCGSNLSAKYLRKSRTIKCPVCYSDMRSETDVARINALEDQLSAKRQELSEAEDEAKHRLQSTGRKWLVQYKVAV